MKKYIGKKIKEIRVFKNLRQCDVTCVSKVTLSRLERGEKPYMASVLFDVIQFLKCNVELRKGNEVFRVRTKEDIASALKSWRGNNTLYSLAKEVSAVWKRFGYVEECRNYGIDQLLLYLSVLQIEVDIK